MLVTIPSVEENVFLDIRLTYDIIATAGPPAPLFDVSLTGWEFTERWRAAPELPDGIETLDECATCDIGVGQEICCCPWSDQITDYCSEHQLELRDMCRNFELTRSESMV